jgi:hypothetical protein
VSERIIVQYVGFEAKDLVREYTFSVREPAGQPRAYTLTIANEAFESRRARYQDAPDICLLRLRRELATGASRAESSCFCVTDAELAAYHCGQKEKRPKSLAAKRIE